MGPALLCLASLVLSVDKAIKNSGRIFGKLWDSGKFWARNNLLGRMGDLDTDSGMF